jgi:hypothetical protein
MERHGAQGARGWSSSSSSPSALPKRGKALEAELDAEVQAYLRERHGARGAKGAKGARGAKGRSSSPDSSS